MFFLIRILSKIIMALRAATTSGSQWPRTGSVPVVSDNRATSGHALPLVSVGITVFPGSDYLLERRTPYNAIKYSLYSKLGSLTTWMNLVHSVVPTTSLDLPAASGFFQKGGVYERALLEEFRLSTNPILAIFVYHR